jgi:hypothetical protein
MDNLGGKETPMHLFGSVNTKNSRVITSNKNNVLRCKKRVNTYVPDGFKVANLYTDANIMESSWERG